MILDGGDTHFNVSVEFEADGDLKINAPRRPRFKNSQIQVTHDAASDATFLLNRSQVLDLMVFLKPLENDSAYHSLSVPYASLPRS